ncbi:hypothetical protein Ahy_A06g029709 [Arachis hypogaea]|uniref:Uncharacterized protein n=1 Tax=Arachis hypogaea TaxID=3818 RepID=A0A445CU17_ARAHY|nr:hypothetical protein Ahy_A06g029709 [Arachis hypogaea]
MIRFKNSRSRYYVLLPESEVVKIAVMALGFYMRRKLLNVHILDLAHWAEKVRQVELMKKEKDKHRNELKLKTGDGLLDFLVQQKIKDRDVSLCPRCNAVFDAKAAVIFEKERMKKELAHREEQARQRQPIRCMEGKNSKAPQQNVVAPLSRSQAIGIPELRGFLSTKPTVGTSKTSSKPVSLLPWSSQRVSKRQMKKEP